MDQKQFDAVLSDAETRLRRLKTLYEQWFVGIERVEPSQARKEFEDLLGRMRKEQTNNTAQRFRLQQLVQRHVTLSTHWRRITRQIEDGTYQRDVLRAKRRKQKERTRDPDEPDIDVSYDIDIDDDLAEALAEAERLAAPASPSTRRAEAAASAPMAGAKLPLGAAGPAKPATPEPDGVAAAHSLTPFAIPDADTQRMRPPRPPKAPPAPPPPLHKQPLVASARTGSTAEERPAPRVPAAPARSAGAGPAAAGAANRSPGGRPAPPRAASGAGFSEREIDRVYKEYVAARGRNAERTDNVRRETIEKTIRGMLPQLEKKHGGKKIDFEVVIRDGRVALKPVAR